MRHLEEPMGRIAVVHVVAAAPLPDIQSGIEQAQQGGIQNGLDQPLRRTARRREVAVASNEHRDAGALGRQDALDVGLHVPPGDQERVKCLRTEDVPHLRRVAPAERIQTGRLRHVAQEPVRIARQEIHVPFEGRPEAGFALLPRCRPVGVEHLEIDTAGEVPEQRRVILDGMRREYG